MLVLETSRTHQEIILRGRC